MKNVIVEETTAKIRGNRCGHDKHFPVLSPICYTPPEKLPQILKDAIDKVNTYYKSPEILDDIRYGRYSPRQVHHRQMPPITHRKVRSEKREAICRILKLFLANTDLTSCRFGLPLYKKHAFLVFDLHWVADKTGLSYYRVCRAIRDLKHAKLISTTERSEVEKTLDTLQFRSRTAIRVIQKKLFLALGISKRRYENERKQAYARQQKKIDNAGGKKIKGYLEMKGHTGRRKQEPRYYKNYQKKGNNNIREQILKRRLQLSLDPLLEHLSYEERQRIITDRLMSELIN